MNNGYNPMRWDCEKNGCFNKKCRPKIEIFAECFPNRIAFSDIDAIVEINRHFLLLEWKSYAGPIPVGQRLMYERMTASGIFTVFLVCGNAETMEVKSFAPVWKGKIYDWRKCSTDEFKESIRKWTALALKGAKK